VLDCCAIGGRTWRAWQQFSHFHTRVCSFSPPTECTAILTLTTQVQQISQVQGFVLHKMTLTSGAILNWGSQATHTSTNLRVLNNSLKWLPQFKQRYTSDCSYVIKVLIDQGLRRSTVSVPFLCGIQVHCLPGTSAYSPTRKSQPILGHPEFLMGFSYTSVVD
jgi:hypothetical protein